MVVCLHINNKRWTRFVFRLWTYFLVLLLNLWFIWIISYFWRNLHLCFWKICISTWLKKDIFSVQNYSIQMIFILLTKKRACTYWGNFVFYIQRLVIWTKWCYFLRFLISITLFSGFSWKSVIVTWKRKQSIIWFK